METKKCDMCKLEKGLLDFTRKQRSSKTAVISLTCNVCLLQPKICSICGKEKPISAFQKNRTKSGVHIRHQCSSCRVTQRNWIRKKQVMEHIGQTTCQECGNPDLRVLAFHHWDAKNKKFKLSGNFCKKFEVLIEEALKCQVLCSNCHIILHSPMAPSWCGDT